MAEKERISYKHSYTFSDFDILPGHIPKNLTPENIDISAPMVKYNIGEQPQYRITIPIVSAAMQCISGNPNKIDSNMAMYRLTGVAGTVNCTQKVDDQAAVIRLLKQNGAKIVPAAISTRDYEKRIPELVNAGADIFFVDTSQGMSDYQEDTIKFSKNNYPIPVIGGNIVTDEGFDFLIRECDADGVKEGMSSGRGCTTGHVLGLGRKPATATEEIAAARDRYLEETGSYVPIYVDGGVNAFSDIPKALIFGGDIVMIGRMIAGTDEMPNKEYEVRFLDNDRIVYEGPAKEFWYEASYRAMFKSGVPGRDYSEEYEEGIEGWVPCSGSIEPFLSKAFKITKDAARKAGCKNIEDLHKKAQVELSEREVYNGNDLDVAIWPYKNVHVKLDGEWKPATAPEVSKILLRN